MQPEHSKGMSISSTKSVKQLEIPQLLEKSPCSKSQESGKSEECRKEFHQNKLNDSGHSQLMADDTDNDVDKESSPQISKSRSE